MTDIDLGELVAAGQVAGRFPRGGGAGTLSDVDLGETVAAGQVAGRFPRGGHGTAADVAIDLGETVAAGQVAGRFPRGSAAGAVDPRWLRAEWVLSVRRDSADHPPSGAAFTMTGPAPFDHLRGIAYAGAPDADWFNPPWPATSPSEAQIVWGATHLGPQYLFVSANIVFCWYQNVSVTQTFRLLRNGTQVGTTVTESYTGFGLHVPTTVSFSAAFTLDPYTFAEGDVLTVACSAVDYASAPPSSVAPEQDLFSVVASAIDR